MPAVPITDSALRSFSPAMKDHYRDVLLSQEGQAILAGAGILANGRRLCHFLGQFGAETGGGTLVRESLTYTTVDAVRRAWSARAAKVSNEWIVLHLLRKPVALGDWAYGGRMGNAKGDPERNPHPDGYDFRGGGWIQTTGRAAVQRYCDRLGIPMRSDILNDAVATLRFACFEWAELGCNEKADADDLYWISWAINTGKQQGVEPNGLEHRLSWCAKARAIWWELEPQASPVWEEDLAVEAVRARVAASGKRAGNEEVSPPPQAIAAQAQVPEMKPFTTSVSEAPLPGPLPLPGEREQTGEAVASGLSSPPSPQPSPLGMLRTAAGSGTILSLINAKLVLLLGGIWGFFGWLWDWLLTLLDVLPLITRDVGGSAAEAEKIRTFLRIPDAKWIAISAAIMVPLIAIAVVRHMRDKRALEQGATT